MSSARKLYTDVISHKVTYKLEFGEAMDSQGKIALGFSSASLSSTQWRLIAKKREKNMSYL